uniref:GGDEF domain-containing protein n=1 Tax=Syphacia muris TaxID=451379 RepID=A0A0N5ADF8_9BILA
MSLFGDRALESLYQKSQLFQTRTTLSHLLFVFDVSLLVVAAIHIGDPNLALLAAALAGALFLLLQILLHLRPSLTRYILYASVQLLLLCSITLYPSAYTSLLPNLIVLFTIYSLIPLPLASTIIIATLLSVSQLIALYFFAQKPTLNQVR